MTNLHGQPLAGLVRDVVVDAIEAIGDELSAQASADTAAIDLRNGRPVGQVGSQRLWSFEVDAALPVPPETPGRLVLAGREPARATILAAGDLDVVLGVDEELGDTLPRASLSVQPWFILDALRDRLTGALEDGGDVVLAEALLDLDDPAQSTSTEPRALPTTPRHRRQAAHEVPGHISG